MYLLTITKDGEQVENISITDAIYEKVRKAITVKPKAAAKPKAISGKTTKPKFVDLGEDDFESDIYDEDGELNLDFIKDCLMDAEYAQWDDKTGEKDNAKPFRLLVNKKFLIEFEVTRGDCIEATWDSRIWRAEIDSIKLIETLEKKDKSKSKINPFQKCFGDIQVLTEVNYSTASGKKEVIKISNCGAKWMNWSHDYYAHFEEVELVEDFEDTTLKKFGVELKSGMHIYHFYQSDNFFIFKLKPEDEKFYSVQYTAETRYHNKFFKPLLKEDEVLLLNSIYKITSKYEIGEFIGGIGSTDDLFPYGSNSDKRVRINKGTLIYDVKVLNTPSGTILFKLNPDEEKYYFTSYYQTRYKLA